MDNKHREIVKETTVCLVKSGNLTAIAIDHNMAGCPVHNMARCPVSVSRVVDIGNFIIKSCVLMAL